MSIVATSYGRLKGAVEDGVHVFRGIPFARPPVGELRWRTPERPAPWGDDVREATAFGPCAIQDPIPGVVGELIGIATHETSEDCLYLNVWTPSPDAAKRPVLVWIHGGGNTVGAGSQPRVNGEHLARIGDVVVVTVNYRLGALGFLYAPELGATGNEALLDQVLALSWVREEIEAFGGDPANVTVFGQSAGGFDIGQLMAMQRASGTFDKAIPMSGSLMAAIPSEQAHEKAQQLAEHFGGFDKLREVDAEAILVEQAKTGRWGPVLDGDVVEGDAAVILREGRYTRDMPLMVGHTRDEWTQFTAFDPRFAELDDAGKLVELAEVLFPDKGEEAVRRYQREREQARLSTTPFWVWSAMLTDQIFRIPAIRTAECHLAHSDNVWMYRFDYPSPARDGMLGACHSLDIPFVWGTYGNDDMQRFCGTDAAVAELSRQMMASTLAFARTGDPNHEGLPHWPRYTQDARATMLFDATSSVAETPLDDTRVLWAEIALSRGGASPRIRDE